MKILVEMDINPKSGDSVNFLDIYHSIFQIENTPLYLKPYREVTIRISKVEPKV